jgi:hypothetical protein
MVTSAHLGRQPACRNQRTSPERTLTSAAVLDQVLAVASPGSQMVLGDTKTPALAPGA